MTSLAASVWLGSRLLSWCKGVNPVQVTASALDQFESEIQHDAIAVSSEPKRARDDMEPSTDDAQDHTTVSKVGSKQDAPDRRAPKKNRDAVSNPLTKGAQDKIKARNNVKRIQSIISAEVAEVNELMLACKSSTVFFERATPDQITRWRTAAERGVVEAMYLYGRVLLDGPDAVKAQTAGCDWLRRASEHNFSLAQLRLAFCYRDEEGVRRDATETVKLLRKSAEQGHATAQCKLGECYSFGLGVKAELKEGVKWYRKSSQQQNGDGRFQLACAYFTGRGIKQDTPKAVSLFFEAASLGSPEAHRLIGSMYEQGDGLPQNDQKAAEWILKAAELGDSEAMYYAAMYYALGKGVRQNRPLYNEWIEKSAKAGYSDAVQQMKTGFSFANSSSTYSSPSENEQWNEYHRKNDEAREMRNRNGIGNSGSPYGY